METITLLMLFSAGIAAGMCNAVAGGGTFFSFPVFLATGIPPIVANASNSIAVWPGNVMAVINYRKQLMAHAGEIKTTIFISFIAGVMGAILLFYTGNAAFEKMIPYLILLATLLFMFGGKLKALFTPSGGTEQLKPSIMTRMFEFVVALYGGFFGGGLGIMLMASLQLTGFRDIHLNNALKNLLGAVISFAAFIIFSFSGIVHWPYTLVAFTGAIIGGFLGARLAKSLSAKYLRIVVIAFGCCLTVYYFYKYM
jgi:uncharacterized membrane protein YfcA